jgi:hypothetical protein
MLIWQVRQWVVFQRDRGKTSREGRLFKHLQAKINSEFQKPLRDAGVLPESPKDKSKKKTKSEKDSKKEPKFPAWMKYFLLAWVGLLALDVFVKIASHYFGHDETKKKGRGSGGNPPKSSGSSGGNL